VRWAIEIRKTSLTSRNLSDLLERLGFELVDGIEYLALVSSAIEACETAAEVFEIAKNVRAAFSGPSQVDSDFTLGSVIEFSTNLPRYHVFLEAGSCVQINSCSGGAITLPPPAGLSPAELLRWHTDNEELKYQALLEQQLSRLEPAFTNSKAAKVLELLSIKNPSAEVVYKIYELAEGPLSSRVVFHKQFAISQDDFNRFRDAVHNPSVSGDCVDSPVKSTD
jgi:hypothetical protein